MKLTDAVLSMILKKGILYEAHNCDMEFKIPTTIENAEGKTVETEIKIQFKADNMTLRIEKSNNG